MSRDKQKPKERVPEEGSDWLEGQRIMNEELRFERQKNREARVPDIMGLAKKGYTVRAITNYQYRINGRLDIYPTRARYHDIERDVRGNVGDLHELVESILGKAEVPA